MDAILVGKNGTETAKELSVALGITYGHIIPSRHLGWRFPSKNLGPHHIIRWGCICRVSYYGLAPVVYNNNRGVRSASDKQLARELMFLSGVPIPNACSVVYPCIGRTSHHRAGMGFWVCHNSEEVEQAMREGAEYFSEFYPKTREFRVHVGHGAVLFVQEKVPREGREELRNEYIWNHANGNFIFQVTRQNLWPLNVIQAAVKAVEALGLDFGGVDVMSDPVDESLPECVVCEVNTAPTLSGESYGLGKYVEYFKWLLSDPNPISHFKVESGAKKDYVLSHLIGGQE